VFEYHCRIFYNELGNKKQLEEMALLLLDISKLFHEKLTIYE